MLLVCYIEDLTESASACVWTIYDWNYIPYSRHLPQESMRSVVCTPSLDVLLLINPSVAVAHSLTAKMLTPRIFWSDCFLVFCLSLWFRILKHYDQKRSAFLLFLFLLLFGGQCEQCETFLGTFAFIYQMSVVCKSVVGIKNFVPSSDFYSIHFSVQQARVCFRGMLTEVVCN